VEYFEMFGNHFKMNAKILALMKIKILERLSLKIEE
jgi:hypothetical protein